MRPALTIPGNRIGIGGFHLGKPADPEVGIEIVRHALDGGVALIDNSWDYHEGESERRVGRALSAPGYRERAFVMTKADSRSYDGLMRQFSESLERLMSDHVDLLQLHEVIRDDDPERALAEGALRALAELREQGAARYIGATGHKDPDLIVRMMDAAERAGARLDTVQMPINPFDLVDRSFRRIVVPEAEQRGIAVLGMKPLVSADAFGQEGSPTAPELLRWALSQPVTVCITGCESVDQVDQALDVAAGFTAMTADEQLDLERRCADLVSKHPRTESYKYTHDHDATLKNPSWTA